MVRSQRLAVDEVVVLMRKDHPSAGEPITATLYAELPHVKLSQSATGTTVIEDVLASRGLKRPLPMTAASWFDIPNIVAQSDLIAIAPERLLKLYPRLSKLEWAPLALEEVFFPSTFDGISEPSGNRVKNGFGRSSAICSKRSTSSEQMSFGRSFDVAALIVAVRT